MTGPVRVLVADDQALVRGSFRVLVDTAPDLTVVGEAVTGAEAVELAGHAKPQVVLMDVRMPVMDGIEATRRITAASPGVRVLILTTFDLDEYVFAGLRAGASGFMLKDTPPADLLAAIRVVAAGEALLAPSVTRRLIAEFTSRPEPAHRIAASLVNITEREREVLTLIGLGLSNVEIAQHLHVTLSTAKTHVGRLLMKLNARDRAQLVIAAYETGLIRAAAGEPLSSATPSSAPAQSSMRTAALALARPGPPGRSGGRRRAARPPTTHRRPRRRTHPRCSWRG